jgi:hypothetical protein
MAVWSQDDWDELLRRLEVPFPWHEREWWHNKYYKENPLNENDGDRTQRSLRGQAEVPNRRQIFYPSPSSRFSLGGELPVAYFSADFSVNCAETIKKFSNNSSLPFHELHAYLRGETDPIPGQWGYPLCLHLSRKAKILDVTTQDSPFFRLVKRRWGEEQMRSLWTLFRSREDEAKKATQVVAIEAWKHGFDGLAYTSVRAPIDIATPDENLVVFNPEMILEEAEGGDS